MSFVEEKIKQKKFVNEDHRGCRVTCIRDSDLVHISQTCCQTVRSVFITSMLMDITPLRYLRNSPAISLDDQIVLAGADVSVIGAGGLGGHIIALLTRLGVGRIRIFDPDVFEETNLNRQCFCITEHIGLNKADATAQFCSKINPAVDVESHPVAITSMNQGSGLTGTQVIIDALDNTKDRIVLAAIANALPVPYIHGAVAGFEGRMMTVLPGHTTFTLLYPPKPDSSPETVSAEKILGTPALSPAFVAPLQVMAALHILLKRDPIATDQLIHADLNTLSLDKFTF